MRSAKVTRMMKEGRFLVVYVQISFFFSQKGWSEKDWLTPRSRVEQLPTLDSFNLPSMNDSSSEVSGLE